MCFALDALSAADAAELAVAFVTEHAALELCFSTLHCTTMSAVSRTDFECMNSAADLVRLAFENSKCTCLPEHRLQLAFSLQCHHSRAIIATTN